MKPKDKYSILPFWDSRVMNKRTKLSRIMLTINLHGKLFRITLKLKSTKADYEKAISATSKNLSDEAKSVRKDLNEYLLKGETIMERLENPTKEMFVKFFKSETDLLMVSKTSIVPYFEAKIDRLFLEDKFSSSSSYQLALKSLLKYHPNELNFKNIDGKFLNGYVSFMLKQGNSTATAGIYLRNLRSIYNDVIKAGIMPESSYPFRNFKFSSNVKSKDVLYPQQLKQLLNYETVDEREQKAIDYFFFCYTCNGMNFQDAGLLQYKNIQGNIMTFVRHKTKSTGKEVKVYIHDLTREIIKKWGNPNQNPEAYIFGLVPPEMTSFEVRQKLNSHKRASNKLLSRIGRELGFDVHLCLNLARHSFATKLKIDNVSVAAISDAMGHTTTNTTEHYMKSLPNENLKIMSNSLLAF